MKEAAKILAMAFCRLLVLPTWAGYRVTALFVDADKAFHGASQRASLWPGILGEYRRREFYRMTLDACSDDCCLSFGTILSKRHARIGRRVYVGTHCNLGLVSLEGAGSIVTGPLPDRAVAVGVPARPVGERGANARAPRETSIP